MKFRGKFLVLVAAGLALALFACSDDNPFESVENVNDEAYLDALSLAGKDWSSSNAANSDDDGYSSSSSAKSSSSSYYYDESSSSSSSSSSSLSSSSSSSSSSIAYLSDYYYLTEAKTIVFTLTYYKQTSSGWDVSGSSSDGDPEVSFKIKCGSSVTGSTTTLSTGTLIDLSDTGEWSGSKTYTGTVPVGTDTLKVCPSVVDGDILFDDDKSSGYCYYHANLGYKIERQVYYQSDYMSDDYELEWQWYLY